MEHINDHGPSAVFNVLYLLGHFRMSLRITIQKVLWE